MTLEYYIYRDVTDPKGIVQVYRDYWWWCKDGDPKLAMFYRPWNRGYGSAQCNSNKVCAEVVGKSLGYESIASLVQIPLAFVPWEDRQ
jgi:hypothetical protein